MVKLIARLVRMDEQQRASLQQQGVRTRKFGWFVVAYLRRVATRSDGFLYRLPSELHSAELTLEAVESGGATFNGGSALVVCDRRGRPRRAATWMRKRPTPCGEHESFVGRRVVTVAAEQDGYLQLHEHSVVDVDAGAVLHRQVCLWSGEFDWLPQQLGHYRRAAEAAIGKARCSNCCEAHYVRRRQLIVVREMNIKVR